jgi:hypothetical protein
MQFRALRLLVPAEVGIQGHRGQRACASCRRRPGRRRPRPASRGRKGPSPCRPAARPEAPALRADQPDAAAIGLGTLVRGQQHAEAGRVREGDRGKVDHDVAGLADFDEVNQLGGQLRRGGKVDLPAKRRITPCPLGWTAKLSSGPMRVPYSLVSDLAGPAGCQRGSLPVLWSGSTNGVATKSEARVGLQIVLGPPDAPAGPSGSGASAAWRGTAPCH